MAIIDLEFCNRINNVSMTLTPQHVFGEAVKRLKYKAFLTIKEEIRDNIIRTFVLYILLPLLYVIAIMKNFDIFQSTILTLLAIATGMFAVGRVGIKFFKELLDVIIEYRKQNITIDGAKWFFIILAITVFIIVVCIICLALYLSHNAS